MNYFAKAVTIFLYYTGEDWVKKVVFWNQVSMDKVRKGGQQVM